MPKDFVAGVLLMAVSAAYYAATVRIPVSALADEVGPHGLPTILAALLALVGLGIGARAWILGRVPSGPAGDQERKEASPRRAFGLLVVGALYVPVAWLAGYVPALVVVLAGVALYEGMRPSWRMAAVVLGGTAFFWLLFTVVLGVAQPTGIFF